MDRREGLVGMLEVRFEAHMQRHQGRAWADVRVRLMEHPEQSWWLDRMVSTCGGPTVVGRDDATGEVVFVGCSQ